MHGKRIKGRKGMGLIREGRREKGRKEREEGGGRRRERKMRREGEGRRGGKCICIDSNFP